MNVELPFEYQENQSKNRLTSFIISLQLLKFKKIKNEKN